MLKARRDIKTPTAPVRGETIADRFTAWRLWAEENTRAVAITGGAVLLVVSGFIVYRMMNASSNQEAEIVFSRIRPVYDAGDMRKAIDGDPTKESPAGTVQGLKFIVDEFGSTKTGKLAALYLGNAYFSLGQYDSAYTAFDHASSSDPILKASIEAGLAAVAEAKGNFRDAAEGFDDAARRSVDNPNAPEYIIDAARCAVKASEKKKAIALYQRLLEEFPNSQYDDQARRGLAGLGEAP